MGYYNIEDVYYIKIQSDIKAGIINPGYSYAMLRYSFCKKIGDYPICQRTPELCSGLILDGKSSFEDVPEKSRTREFFLNTFTDRDVFNYIKKNINNFDKQFFKDLLVTNPVSLVSKNNCFSIIPLEYIDEEMCSLAFIQGPDWADFDWFYSVVKRKPGALNADLWKLAARFYARLTDEGNKILEITPDEYKDEEYYKEMCRCDYNNGHPLRNNKGRIMNSVPKNILSPKFIFDLMKEDLNNVCRFSEEALEIYCINVILQPEKVWQYVLRLDGHLIRYIPLNPERIEFFLSLYNEETLEYKNSFMDVYDSYKKNLNNDSEQPGSSTSDAASKSLELGKQDNH